MKQASSAINRDELRGHYRTLLDFIKKERGMRDRVLAELRRAKALVEADVAKASLAALGAAVGDQLAEEKQVGQPTLFELERVATDRGDY